MPTPFAAADGPSPSRAWVARTRNERIAAAARLNRFDREIAIPFVCECSDGQCDDLIRLPLRLYEAVRDESDHLTAPGHQVDAARIVRIKDGVWLYRAAARDLGRA